MVRKTGVFALSDPYIEVGFGKTGSDINLRVNAVRIE